MRTVLYKIWDLYYDGFKNMTIGKTLWFIILVKLFVMFFILKLFFFPNYLGDIPTSEEKSDYVGNELIERAASLPNEIIKQ